MKMKREPSAENKTRRSRNKLIYVKSVAEIPDFRSDDEIAEWYQTHSTVLIQDQLQTLPAKMGGALRSRSARKRSEEPRASRSRRYSRSGS